MKQIKSIYFVLILLSISNKMYSQLWKTYEDTAKIYLEKEEPEIATQYFIKANLILAQDSAFTASYQKNTKTIGDYYFSRNQYAKASPYYLTIRKIILKVNGKYSSQFAGNADTLGQIFFSSDAAQAQVYFNEAKDIREKIFTKNSKEYATSCNNLGNLYNSTGENENAKTLYLEAIKLREKLLGKDDPAYAQSCNNLANVYWKMGDYENAEFMALEAKRMREKLLPVKLSRAYAITCTNLANIYRDIGQYQKAEALYLEALNIRATFAPLKQNIDYASSCNILADLYYFMGKYQQAEPLYLEAKNIREKQLSNTSKIYAESCNNLASLYKEMAQYHKAGALLFEAKKIYDALPADDPSHAININNLGELFFAEGDFTKANKYFFAARELWEKNLGKEHPYYYQNAANIAKVYWNMNEAAKADSFYRESFRLQYAQVDKVFRFTNEFEKQLFLKNINSSGDEYQSFYYQQTDHNNADYPYTISLLNRNLILSSTQQLRNNIYKSRHAGMKKKYELWVNLKQKLAKFYSATNGSDATEIKKLEEDANILEKEISRSSSAFKNAQKQISWHGIKNNLKENEAAIEFIQFQKFDGRKWADSTFYVALLLRKDKANPISIPLFEGRQLELLLGQANKATGIKQLYTRGVTDDVATNSSASIYELLWKPIEQNLKGIKKIYYSPAGNLFKISFAALPVNNTQVLNDKYQLMQLNTTASVTNDEKKFIFNSNKIQLYGGIKYDVDSSLLKQSAFTYRHSSKAFRSLPGDVTRGNGFEYLPGTLNEIVAIKKLADKVKVPAAILSGTQATEESFYGLNGNSSPSILQIATHGFFFPDHDSNEVRMNENPGRVFRQSHDPLMRSGLLFAGANAAWKGNAVSGVQDGILTAYEISNMHLPNTKLVVLSACKTALGDIQGSEGVYGLQRAFKMAGVENLVMSLWEVPDAETVEFMQIFYKNIFTKNSISDAFLKAQTAMKNKYRAEPYKWAAWILVR